MSNFKLLTRLKYVRDCKHKITTSEAETIEWLLCTNTAVRRIIKLLDEQFGVLESLVDEPLYFSRLLRAGAKAVTYLNEDKLITIMQFNQAIIDELALCMEMELVSKSSMHRWDIFVESAAEFYHRNEGNVRVCHSPNEMDDSMLEYFKAMLAGRIFTRDDMGHMNIPHLGRTRIYRELTA